VILDVPTFAWARSLAPVRRLMIADMLARDAYGRNKYKVPLTYDNARDHLQDAYQEALDMVAYLKAESMAGDDTYAARLLYQKAIAFALELRTAIAQRDGECQ
jgi:predicted S18 family serine protease